MREITRNCLSVLLAVAVIGAGTVAWVNLDRGPEPVDNLGAVQDGEAAVATSTAIGLYLAGTATVGAACAAEFLICQGDTEAINQSERSETKAEISARAGTAVQQAEVFTDTMNNSLEGASSIGRSEGMQAYWDAIENGQSLSASKQAGKQAVKDFYHVKYTQVAASWNIYTTSMAQYETLERNANLPNGYVELDNTNMADSDWQDSPTLGSNQTIVSPNGSGVEFVSIADSSPIYPTEPGYGSAALRVGYHNQTFATVNGPTKGEYTTLLNKIDTQSSQVQQAIDTVANETYQKAINGEINASDVLSANTIAREYSQEGNDQAWAAIRLSQIRDVAPPEGLENIGSVTVTSDGTTETGVFLSRTNPASGSFQSGNSYNASKLSGKQMIVREDGSFGEITGDFTLDKITKPDGSTKSSLTVRKPNYEATNISEWRAFQKNISELRAGIDARQQKLLNGSSGGSGGLFAGADGLIPGLNGPQGVVVLIVGLMTLLAAMRAVLS